MDCEVCLNETDFDDLCSNCRTCCACTDLCDSCGDCVDCCACMFEDEDEDSTDD